MTAVKPSRKASFTPEESAEASRLWAIMNEASARGDIDTFAKTAAELAGYLMALLGVSEGDA